MTLSYIVAYTEERKWQKKETQNLRMVSASTNPERSRPYVLLFLFYQNEKEYNEKVSTERRGPLLFYLPGFHFS